MDMDTLNPQEEEQLIGAVKQAVALVEDGGLSPDQAIEKIARDLSYTPGRIRFLCHGYNQGTQLSQWHENKNVLDKLAAFQLADADKVIRAIYDGPSTVEKAASAVLHDDYLTPPTFFAEQEKRASALTSLPGVGTVKQASVDAPPPKSVSRQLADIEREKRAADEAGTQATRSEDQVRGHVSELVYYFKTKVASDRHSFAFFEKAAQMYQGDIVTPLLDLVYHGSGLTEKRADDSMPISREPVRWDRMPFSALKDCVKYAVDAVKYRRTQTSHVEKTAQLKEAVLVPFVKRAAAKPPQPSLNSAASPLYSEKVAGIFGTPAGLALGSMFGAALSEVPNRDKLVGDVADDLDDPNHQNEIRKIKNQVMLTRAMSDPDDTISGHTPDDVLRQYNEISGIAPHAADQPAALLPLLRRRLEGHVEPFEAKELTDIEKGLASVKHPSLNIMPNANAPKSPIR